MVRVTQPIDIRGTLPHMTRWKLAAGVAGAIGLVTAIATTHVGMGMRQPSAPQAAAPAELHLTVGDVSAAPPWPVELPRVLSACTTYDPDGNLSSKVTPGAVSVGPVYEFAGTYSVSTDVCKTFGNPVPPCTAPTFDQCITKP